MESKNLYELLERMAKDEVETISDTSDELNGGTSDMLHAIKVSATNIGLTPLHVWATFANRHWQRVMTYVRSGKESSVDPIENCIKDLRNHLAMLRALVEENKTVKPQPGKFVETNDPRKLSPKEVAF